MSNDSTALNTEIVLSSIIDSLDDISVTANMKPMKPAKIELPFWNHFLAGGYFGFNW